MKKLLLVLAFPMLLISCGKANAQQEVSYAGIAAEMEAPQALRRAVRSVGKFSGSRKTQNGQLIGMQEDMNQNINGTCTYSFNNNNEGVLDTGTQPPSTSAPYQLNYAKLAATAKESVEQTAPNGQTLTWLAFSSYYISPLRVVLELVSAQANASGGQAVYYQKFDLTFNKEQYLSKLEYTAKINYFQDGQAAFFVAQTTGTYSYTYY